MECLGSLDLEALKTVQVEFVPDNWINTYRHWKENLQDWCISRQLSWGHRIPAWYDEDGNIHVGRSEAEARQRGGLAPDAPCTRDEAGLEAWLASGVGGLSTVGGPDGARRRSGGF